jgi:Mrp family chromosome partitioning ATPase
LDDPGFSETERADAVARARRFFDLAVGYVDRQGAGRRGGLLVTCGITGTGKSTVARALAKARSRRPNDSPSTRSTSRSDRR